MDELARLDAALDAKPAPVVCWWRDDDAGEPSPRLDQLLLLADRLAVPLALAVVPAWLSDEVAGLLRAHTRAVILQHGWSHADHALPGGKKIELGGAVAADRLAEQLDAGRRLLVERAGDRFLPVMVPPWNRIRPDIVSLLPGLGFRGLSTFAGQSFGTEAGLTHRNPTIDPIAWRAGKRFAPTDELALSVIEMLAAPGNADIGMLTHHRDMDDAAFASLEVVLTRLRRHPKTTWPTAARIFRC